jgi:ankyrin repeat protein
VGTHYFSSLMTWTPLFFQLAGKPFSEATLLPLVPYIKTLSVNGSSPLHFAALRKDLRFVQFLIAHGAKVNQTNQYHETPLHWAVKAGHEHIVSLLLASGAKANIRDSEDLSPLDWAREEDQTHLIPLLKSRKPKTLQRSTSYSIPIEGKSNRPSQKVQL